MGREAVIPFMPAVLAALTDAVTAAMVRGNQSDYPGGFIVFQILMFGVALLAAVPRMWVRLAAFVLLLAGIFISGFSVGFLYLPTLFAVLWVMVRDERPAVQSGQ